MDWSFSESATFARCPRQWYFRHHLANANAIRTPIRRMAYRLSKVYSIWAWRGKIVDRAISRHVIPAIRSHRKLELNECVAHARQIFEQQLAFGADRSQLKAGLMGPGPDKEFAGFQAVEYGLGLKDEEVAQAWREITQALTNLLTLQNLIATLERAEGIVVQRPLRFALDLPTHGSVMVRATPDLIAFSEKRPPLIVDWKVRTMVAADARIQLAVYALGLVRGQPHRDFPSGISRYRLQDLQLLEIRLLEGTVREYILSEDDLADLEAHIFYSVSRMKGVLDGRSPHELRAEDFPTTLYPGVCEACSFRAICWEDPKWRQSSQTSFQF